MELLTAEKLLELKHGDMVWKVSGDGYGCRRLDYVGRMPRSERYLIFSDGEYLTHLYISEKDNSFSGEYYGGGYDDKFILKKKIAYHEEMIKTFKEWLKID